MFSWDILEGVLCFSMYRIRLGGAGDRGSIRIGYCFLSPMAVVEGIMVQ